MFHRHLRATLTALTVTALAAGVLTTAATSAVHAAGTPPLVASQQTIPFQLSDDLRGTTVTAATDVGYLYVTTLKGDVTHPVMFYKAYAKQTPLNLGTPPNGWVNSANRVDQKNPMYTVNGKDTYTYAKTCETGGTQVIQKTFTPDPSSENVTVATSTLIGCDSTIWNTYTYLGWSGGYTYVQQSYIPNAKGWSTDVKRVSTSIPNPSAADLELVGNFGDTIKAFEADSTHLLIAYMNSTEPYNGSAGRVAYLPTTSTNISHDTGVIGRFNDGGLGLVALNPAGAVWSQTAPNDSSTQIVVYRRAAQKSHTYSGRLTGLSPTNPLATVASPDGQVWLLWTDSSGGQDTENWAYGKINALQVGGSIQTVWSAVSGGQIMATASGKAIAYTPTNPDQPRLSVFTATNSGTPAVSQTVNIDALPAPVFGLGTSDRSLWMQFHPRYTDTAYQSKSWTYPTAGSPATDNASRHSQIRPTVSTNDDILTTGGNLAVTGNTMMYYGRSPDSTKWDTGIHAVSTGGDIRWSKSTDYLTGVAFTGASDQAVGWRFKQDGTYQGRYSSVTDGATTSLPSDAVAHLVAGGVYYYAPGGQIGYINRGYLGSPVTHLIPVDLSCTINVQAAYSNYLLYDCGGTQKIAELTWNGTGFLATTTELPGGATQWRLGDGYLAYRKQDGTRFEFGVRDLSTMQDTPIATTDNYDTSYGLYYDRPAPQFTTDLTGGHRMIYADGDQNLHVVSLNIPSLPKPAPATVTAEHSSITPNGNGINDAWTAGLTWNANPSAWMLTIEDSADRTVKTFTGAPSATVPQTASLIWDGRDDHGAVVPDGTYTWVLSSTPVNDVQTTTQTGTITVRQASTKPSISTPAVATSNVIPITVTSPTPFGVTGWTPYYQVLTTNADGTVTPGPWVQAGASSPARTIYVTVPTGVRVNTKLVPDDTLGEPVDSDPSVTIVPSDSQSLKVTKKWVSLKTTQGNPYMDTLRYTTANTAKITYTTTGPGVVHLTGLKNSKQGRYWVWLDGKKTSTKPLTAYRSSSSTKPVSLYTSPKLGAGKHTVVLQNYVTKSPKKWKKRVRLTVDSAYTTRS